MNFDTINTTSCIPGCGGTGTNGSSPSGGSGSGSGSGSGTDSRCQDSAFAAANPDICGSASYIVIKPSTNIIVPGGSIQFNVFLYQNGTESQITTGLLFGSSDSTIFVIGASSGNGTGLSAGSVVVTASYQGLTVTADVTVISSSIGCNNTPCATAILIDNSNSMSLNFGGPYSSRLVFAQAVAQAYSGSILQVAGQPKDSISVFSFSDIPNQISSGFISDTSALSTQISGVTQGTGDTDLSSAISSAVSTLRSTTAVQKIILIISDGEQTDTPTEQQVLTAASSFLQAGGIIMCIGCRASTGFDLLDRLATGGFFLNATSSNASAVLQGLSYLKSSVCAGQCVLSGDYYQATGEIDYSSFLNWSVINGQVNLLGNSFMDFLPGNGLYVELASSNNPATIESIDTFTLNPGDTYELSFSLAGNNQLYTPAANAGVMCYVKDSTSGLMLLQQTASPNWNAGFLTYQFSFTAQYAATVRVGFAQQVATGFTGSFAGNLLDNVLLKDLTTLLSLLVDNFDDEHITYTPPGCGPSAALTALSNPGIPSLGYLNYYGGSQVNSETYKYSISYVTLQGETSASPVISTASLSPVTYPMQATMLSSVFPDPNVYPADRITAIHIWRNDASASSTLYLLASVNPETVNYIDLESHAQFSARVGSQTAPASNTTAVAAGALGTGSSGCYEPACDSSVAIGAQSPDPNVLPNIEAGGSPSGTVSDTEQACGTCPDNGVIGSSNTNLTPKVSTESDGSVFVFDSAVILDMVCWTFSITGSPTGLTIGAYSSPDGVTWTKIRADSGYSLSGSQIGACTRFPPASYTRIKLTYNTSNFTLTAHSFEQIILQSSNQHCESATASGATLQSAQQAATSAANSALQSWLGNNCLSAFTSTKTIQGDCPCGQYGSAQGAPLIGTGTSYKSQAEADQWALWNAQQLLATIDCTQSNNTLFNKIDAPASANGPASIYPSVQQITGFSGVSHHVTVTITNYVGGIQQYLIYVGDLGMCDLLLVSPTGKSCLLKSGTPNEGIHLPNNANWSFTFDDSAAAFIPQNSPPVSGGSYKPTQSGTVQAFPGCVTNLVSQPYGTTLAAVTGDSPNGAWSLWIRSAYSNEPTIPFSLGQWQVNVS